MIGALNIQPFQAFIRSIPIDSYNLAVKETHRYGWVVASLYVDAYTSSCCHAASICNRDLPTPRHGCVPRPVQMPRQSYLMPELYVSIW